MLDGLYHIDNGPLLHAEEERLKSIELEFELELSGFCNLCHTCEFCRFCENGFFVQYSNHFIYEGLVECGIQITFAPCTDLSSAHNAFTGDTWRHHAIVVKRHAFHAHEGFIFIWNAFAWT